MDKNMDKNVFEALRKSEFGNRLEENIYLDHAGSTLFTDTQLTEAHQVLRANLLGNPHSQHPASVAIETDARAQVLKFFNTNSLEYEVIFTSGATSALKIVGQHFPWSQGSDFCYFVDNHTSVVGIREFAIEKGSSFSVVDHHFNHLFQSKQTPSEVECNFDEESFHLFAMPAESNFSGALYDLSLVKRVQEKLDPKFQIPGKWHVLLVTGLSSCLLVCSILDQDAAKFAGCHSLDLAANSPDFVVFSFYKMFGYPTGLGALLIHKRAAPCFSRSRGSGYFAGGTVAAVAATAHFHTFRSVFGLIKGLTARLEEGTPSFLAIAAVPAGLKAIMRVGGVQAISEYVRGLRALAIDAMSRLVHANGAPLVRIYGPLVDGPTSCRECCGVARYRQCAWVGAGSLIALNVLTSTGEYIGYSEVETLALSTSKIRLRTGCFCNPGACQYHLALTASDVQRQLIAGHVCWDKHDLVDGHPTGAVRISFGYMSSSSDVDSWISFLQQFFVDSSPRRNLLQTESFSARMMDESSFISRIFVYPIKSCGRIEATTWPCGPTGLLYDREWSLVDVDGAVLSQKKFPRMCLLQPAIDWETRHFEDSKAAFDSVRISLDVLPCDSLSATVCGDACSTLVYSEEVASWFSAALGVSCKLIRTNSLLKARTSHSSGLAPVSFSNDAQYLVVSEASFQHVVDVHTLTNSDFPDIHRFRPNIVMSSPKLQPFEEDSWSRFQIESTEFQINGPCRRCIMINIDQKQGHSESNLFKTLAVFRRQMSKPVYFGIFLSCNNYSELVLRVGDRICVS